MLYDPNTYKGIKGGTYFDEQEFNPFCSNKVPKSKSTQSNTKIQHQTSNSNVMYKSQKLFTQRTEKKLYSPQKIQSSQKTISYTYKQINSQLKKHNKHHLQRKEFSKNVLNFI